MVTPPFPEQTACLDACQWFLWRSFFLKFNQNFPWWNLRPCQVLYKCNMSPFLPPIDHSLSWASCTDIGSTIASFVSLVVHPALIIEPWVTLPRQAFGDLCSQRWTWDCPAETWDCWGGGMNPASKHFWFLWAGLHASANKTWLYQQSVFIFGFCLTLALAKLFQLELYANDSFIIHSSRCCNSLLARVVLSWSMVSIYLISWCHAVQMGC